MTTFNYNAESDHTFLVADGRKVAIQNESQGVAVFIEGCEDPLLYIDFYYLDPEGREGYHRTPAPQVTVYDIAAPFSDPLAYIKFEPSGTRIAFERGVKVLEHDKQYGDMWGYEI